MPAARVVLCTAGGRARSFELALRHGIQSYLAKPIDLDNLRLTLARALEASRQSAVIATLGCEQPHDDDDSPTNAVLRRAARADATMLLTGETGVGKTHVAKRIHCWSPRAKGPFVHINCAAVPDSLAEAELFGAERGAFTGAVAARMGAFELASGGTLFLDEVAELPLPLQAKMLIALEEKALRRVGGSVTRPIDTRVVAATNRDLEREVAAGRFRHDLLYRLQVLPVRVPALREQPDRIPVIVGHFLAQLAPDRSLRLAPGELEALTRYRWPGNVCELKNVLERSSILDPGPELRPSRHLLVAPSEAHAQGAAPEPRAGATGPTKAIAPLAQVELDHIRATLEQLGGNRLATARALGIGVTTLRRKLAEA